ncbi:unnamed protein product, partial [Amoebophrya sp. A120]
EPGCCTEVAPGSAPNAMRRANILRRQRLRCVGAARAFSLLVAQTRPRRQAAGTARWWLQFQRRFVVSLHTCALRA